MRFITATMMMLTVLLSAAHASETVVVRLRTSSVPSSLRALGAKSVLPTGVDQQKVPETVQSRSQRDAFESLRHYVVLTLPDGVTTREIEDIDGVADVRPLVTMKIHAEPLTNDSLASEQYALTTVGARSAWTMATGKGIVVGIIDTGIDWTHEDLVGAMAVTAAEDVNKNGRFDDWPSDVEFDGVLGDLNGLDEDNNGVADDVIGYDFVDQDVRNIGDDRGRDPIPFDEQGHGTSVGGVIAATPNNLLGIAGLAYGSRLRALRAFDATGNAEEDDIASALVYAALTGVNVVNMSFGDGVDSPMLRDAVKFASAMNVVLVASAGNTGTTSRQYPAGYDEVIAVGSTNEEDRRSPFSSTGSLVALCAPGESIVTTAVNSRYRTVNGTSFAAPYVAAAAAMMLERSAMQMSAAEIRGTLQERSLDLGERGWDVLYGAGRLQVDAALAAQGRSAYGIIKPSNEDEVDVRTTPTLAVMGSVLVAPFDSYSVSYGVGLEPTAWTTINSSNVAVVMDTLARLNTTTLTSGLYTIRLQVACKDGRSLDSRKRITIVNNDVLTITKAEIINAWTTDRRSPVVTVRTSRPTALALNITAENSSTFSDVKRFVRSHSLVVPDSIISRSQIAVQARCTADNDSVAETTLTIAASREGAPSVSGWKKTQSASWSGYVLNDVRDLYGDGLPSFVMNDLSSGSFGGTFTMQYRDGVWSRRDSLTSTWIPRGICDANGNGLLEVLAHVVGRAVLFEQAVVGGSPFARIIYADSSGRQNGAGVADINGDGREELLLLSDSGCTAITYRNGRFDRLGIAVNTSAPSYGNVNNRVDEISVAAGDFDGDGAVEVAFGDTDGDLIISEWDGVAFVNRYLLETNGGGGSGFVASGDVDADGRPDVVFGVPDSTQPDAEREYGRDVWTYRLLRANGNDQYEAVWTDHIAGVRYGIGYRNGVDVGPLDSRPGEEIVICAYPRMYVFGADETSKAIVPRWFVPDVVSPRFLMYDFNKNGINELGYGITYAGLGMMTGFNFSEVDTVLRHPAPASMRGHYVSADSIVLDWMPVADTKQYKIFGSTNNGPYRSLDSTTTTSVTVAEPIGSSSVRFAVVAYPINTTIRESQRSNDAAFMINDQARVIGLDRDTVNRSELRTGLRVLLRYSSDISVDHIEPTQFLLLDRSSGAGVVPTLTAVAGTQQDVVLTFPGVNFSDSLLVRVRHVNDMAGKPVRDTSFPLVVRNDPASTPEFALASLGVRSTTALLVTFTADVDATATNPLNYRLDPIGTVLTATRVDARTIELDLDPASPLTARGITYSLTAVGIKGDPSGVITTGAGNTATFIVTAPDLSSAYVYPHPVRLTRDDEITFGGLTQDATVEVLDGAMRTLVTITGTEGNGGVRWDLRTSAGERIPPGLYFYRVSGTSDQGAGVEPVLKKLMVER